MITKEQMKALPLSDDTARLLSMMTQLQDLWEEAHNALADIYGSDHLATKIIEKEFAPHYDKLEGFFQRYIMESIRIRIYELLPTEI